MTSCFPFSTLLDSLKDTPCKTQHGPNFVLILSDAGVVSILHRDLSGRWIISVAIAGPDQDPRLVEQTTLPEHRVSAWLEKTVRKGLSLLSDAAAAAVTPQMPSQAGAGGHAAAFAAGMAQLRDLLQADDGTEKLNSSVVGARTIAVVRLPVGTGLTNFRVHADTSRAALAEFLEKASPTNLGVAPGPGGGFRLALSGVVIRGLYIYA